MFLDGRVGSDPTEASVEHWKVLIQLVADAVVEDFRGFMDSINFRITSIQNN